MCIFIYGGKFEINGLKFLILKIGNYLMRELFFVFDSDFSGGDYF